MLIIILLTNRLTMQEVTKVYHAVLNRLYNDANPLQPDVAYLYPLKTSGNL